MHVAQAGAGPWDGFTSYVVFGAGRPRWGDYGATAVMNGSIWVGSEYVAQTCDYAAYRADPTVRWHTSAARELVDAHQQVDALGSASIEVQEKRPRASGASSCYASARRASFLAFRAACCSAAFAFASAYDSPTSCFPPVQPKAQTTTMIAKMMFHVVVTSCCATE